MTSFREANSFFRNPYDWFNGPTDLRLFVLDLPEWLAYFLAGLVIILTIVNVLLIAIALYTWFERRAIGRFQSRLGPNRWGPFGILQPFADLLKLLSKEDIVPAAADRWVFNLAPIILFIPVPLVFAVIPFGKNTQKGIKMYKYVTPHQNAIFPSKILFQCFSQRHP